MQWGPGGYNAGGGGRDSAVNNNDSVGGGGGGGHFSGGGGGDGGTGCTNKEGTASTVVSKFFLFQLLFFSVCLFAILPNLLLQ